MSDQPAETPVPEPPQPPEPAAGAPATTEPDRAPEGGEGVRDGEAPPAGDPAAGGAAAEPDGGRAGAQ
ncbi:NADH-quinone oxidoreductase subunit C, partial [Streptomyces sp. NPDC007162]